MHSNLFFKISQLRARNQTIMLTAVAVLLASLFVAALLPSLLVQFVYARQQLFQQPPLLQYIPLASFVVGFGYFLIAVIGNSVRCKRIKYLDKQLELESCCSDDQEVLAELESLTETLVKKDKPQKKTLAQKSRSQSSKKKSSTSKSKSQSKKSKK